MGSNDDIAIIQAAYAAFGRGDIEAILAACADDVDWAADTQSDAAPWYGVRVGKQAVGQFFEDVGKTIEITDFTPLTFAANDDGDVFSIVRWAWTARETGKTASMTLHHWWKVAGGKIVFFRGAEDTPTTLAALA